MKLGDNFTLAEMTVTSTGLDNKPYREQLINLTRLVALVLDPLRKATGPLRVNSGFRSFAVNEAVGGASTSYHTKGLAADVVSGDPDHPPAELIEAVIGMGLPFDKLIDEDNGNSQWLHCQISPPGEDGRKQVFTARIVDGKMKYTEIT